MGLPAKINEDEKVRLEVDIPKWASLRLDALVARSGKSTAFFLWEALLDKLEDFEDLCEAEERNKEVEEGRAYLMTMEEMEVALGLAD